MKIDYSWNGPKDFRRWGPFYSYGNHAATEVTITWQSKFYSMKQTLDFGETPACEKHLEKKNGSTSLHYFELKELKPDTTYYYKISRIEDQQINPQPTYTFKTGPVEGSSAPFDFCVMADYHADSADHTEETLQSMMRNVPDVPLLLTGGDCVTHGGNEQCWNDFFYQLSPYDSKFALMNTTGNHDTDHPETYAHFVQTFHYPYPDPEKGAFYHFIYGNALFIMMDSTNAGQSAALQGVASDIQMEWLEKTLKQYAKQNLWVFIVMHHPIYTTGDTGFLTMFEYAYKDLFEEYHVDGVFYGHDHFFEVVWGARESDWGGINYYLIGNAGGPLSYANLDGKKTPPPPYLWKGRTFIYERDGILGGRKEAMRNDELVKSSHVYGIIEYGFTHLHINGDAAEIKMWGRQNQIFYRDTIKRTGCGKKFHKPEYMAEF